MRSHVYKGTFRLGKRTVLELADVPLRLMLSGDTRNPGQHRIYATLLSC